jgi:hypothetical protein
MRVRVRRARDWAVPRDGGHAGPDVLEEHLLQRAELPALGGRDDRLVEAPVCHRIDRKTAIAGEMATGAGRELPRVRLAEPQHARDQPVGVVEPLA